MTGHAEGPPLRRRVALIWDGTESTAWARRAGAAALAGAAAGAAFGALGAAARPEVGLVVIIVAAALSVATPAQRLRAALEAAAACAAASLAGLGSVGSLARAALLGEAWPVAALASASWWVGGAAAGALVGWRARSGRGGALGAAAIGAASGAAGLGIGAGVGAQLAGAALVWATAGLGAGLGLGLAAAVGRAEERVSHRLPVAWRVERALGPALAAPVRRAAALDARIEGSSPDPETREGLAEIAVWVLRLQWVRRALGEELGAIDPAELRARLGRVEAEGAAATDSFLAERKAAVAAHLQRLLGHHAELAAEDQRTAALVEYALAFLEEARASLALARVQPGDHAPARIHDVLERLRSHHNDRTAQRAAARELEGLSAPAASAGRDRWPQGGGERLVGGDQR